jgi:ABC-2 type transport system ATP-binding protein
MLRLDRISKRHGADPTLREVSLHVEAGECVVISGDSRGTTALMRVASTLIAPDAGSITIDGIDAVRDPFTARQRLAYAGPASLPLTPGVRLRDLWATGPTAALSDFADRNSSVAVATLPPPTRAALSVAFALDRGVSLVLLDNPFAFLDQRWTERTLEWIASAADAATAVVVSGIEPSRVATRCTREFHLTP